MEGWLCVSLGPWGVVDLGSLRSGCFDLLLILTSDNLTLVERLGWCYIGWRFFAWRINYHPLDLWGSLPFLCKKLGLVQKKKGWG